MSERKAIAKNKDLAFQVYREQGGNKERTLAELKKRGLRITKKTLYDWIKKFRFEERRLEVDLEKQRAEDSQLSFEEKMMTRLVKRLDQYDKYFETHPIDNQAQHAYTNLLQTVINLSRKMKPKKKQKNLDEMQREADEILRNEYGLER